VVLQQVKASIRPSAAPNKTSLKRLVLFFK